jgi:hypothetical protein
MELDVILQELAQPPFKKQITVAQLQGEGSEGLSVFQLIQLIQEVVLHIEETNPQSVHLQVDLYTEGADNTVQRLLGFLQLMRYQPTHGSDQKISL